VFLSVRSIRCPAAACSLESIEHRGLHLSFVTFGIGTLRCRRRLAAMGGPTRIANLRPWHAAAPSCDLVRARLQESLVQRDSQVSGPAINAATHSPAIVEKHLAATKRA
jgi:hypothetical protein